MFKASSSRGTASDPLSDLIPRQPSYRVPATNECLNPVTGFPAPLRILCRLTSGNRQPCHPVGGRRVATARLAGKGTDGKGRGARGRLRRLGPLHPDVQSGTRHDTEPVREALRAATAPRRQVHRHGLQRPEDRDLHPCERNTAARSHAAGAAGREGRVRELPDRRRLASPPRSSPDVPAFAHTSAEIGSFGWAVSQPYDGGTSGHRLLPVYPRPAACIVS
jgi:hypothetical protein